MQIHDSRILQNVEAKRFSEMLHLSITAKRLTPFVCKHFTIML